MARWVRIALSVVVSLAALVAAVRLVAPADTTSSVRRQLVFLRHELEAGHRPDPAHRRRDHRRPGAAPRA
ncbi:MAG: hypothetical protein HKP61_01600 [Dactylosporangium sp.]|nr:hypothetical protein [Dactylosporangium sp.]NNJ59659.1 hypothetical protein [Dactylosporangium sp.]